MYFIYYCFCFIIFLRKQLLKSLPIREVSSVFVKFVNKKKKFNLFKSCAKMSILPKNILILFVLAIHFGLQEAAKVLIVFPFPSFSHYAIGEALGSYTAGSGHNVVFLNPFPGHRQKLKGWHPMQLDKFLEISDGKFLY